MEEILIKISKIPNLSEKTNEYNKWMQTFIADNNEHALEALLDHVLLEDTPLVVSRAVLMEFHKGIVHANNQNEFKKKVILYCINKLPSRIASFENEDIVLRDVLADFYVADNDFLEAARVLAVINFENGNKNFEDAERAEIYVKIAELYLQEEDTVNAEIFINRASRYTHAMQNMVLKLRYQVSYARILDAKRKFLDASHRYYELSQSNPKDVEIEQDDLSELLDKAITTAVLGAAGSHRSRLLATLFKDERVASSKHAEILEKMFMQQIVQRPEALRFEETLLHHQKAILSNGFSVLEQAVLEHNIVAIGILYSNIRMHSLGELLQICPQRAEKVVARMISENRLLASIDQIEGFVEFHDDTSQLEFWDSRIYSLCVEANDITEALKPAP